MPEYLHLCTNCNQEFEDFYSIEKDPPTKCPLCNADGFVKRLIAGLPAVKVKLTGQDLKQKIKQDGQKFKQELKQNENLRANMMGEDSYNQSTSETKSIIDSLKS